jgi:hypothetical protein
MPIWQIGALVGILGIVVALSGGFGAEEESVTPRVPERKTTRRAQSKNGPSWMLGDEATRWTNEGTRHVQVFSNGGGKVVGGKQEGNPVTMDAGAFDKLQSEFGGRLFNNQGQIITTFEQVGPHSSIYTGPIKKGTHFMWPTNSVGHKYVASDLFSWHVDHSSRRSLLFLLPLKKGVE